MKSFQLIVPAQIENIPQLVRMVTNAATHARFDNEDIFRCQLVTDEACANIIDHAYAERTPGAIELHCLAENGRLEINLWDEGASFNPVEAMPYEFPPNLNTLQPGGIGLQLIYHYMDVVHFSTIDGRNLLKLIKTPTEDLKRLHQYKMQVYLAEQGVIVIIPRGKLDATFAQDLDNQLDQLLTDGRTLFLLDLRDSTFIVSRVISVMIKYWKSLEQSQGSLLLCNLSPRIEAVMKLIGLDKVMPIYSSRQEALDKLAVLTKTDEV